MLSAEPVCSCALLPCASGTRDRGCSAHPVFPAPSYFRGTVSCKPRAFGLRERGVILIHICGHPRRRVTQYSRGGDDRTDRPRRTGSPAFAGNDTSGRQSAVNRRMGGANGSRERALDDRLRGTHQCRCAWRWVSLRSTHPTELVPPGAKLPGTSDLWRRYLPWRASSLPQFSERTLGLGRSGVFFIGPIRWMCKRYGVVLMWGRVPPFPHR
jgi:hypothetical protein